MDAVERAAKERRLAMTKQISRDDVAKVANNLDGWPQCYPIQEAAAMLRSLMDRVEELEAVVCVSRDALRQCPAETLEHRRDINIAKRACVEALAETDQ